MSSSSDNIINESYNNAYDVLESFHELFENLNKWLTSQNIKYSNTASLYELQFVVGSDAMREVIRKLEYLRITLGLYSKFNYFGILNKISEVLPGILKDNKKKLQAFKISEFDIGYNAEYILEAYKKNAHDDFCAGIKETIQDTSFTKSKKSVQNEVALNTSIFKSYSLCDKHLKEQNDEQNKPCCLIM